MALAYFGYIARMTRAGVISALNVFVRLRDGSWRMIAHHGAPVMRS